MQPKIVKEVMEPGHPDWADFYHELAYHRCNFHKVAYNNIEWECDGDFRRTIALLESGKIPRSRRLADNRTTRPRFPNIHIEATLAFFRDHGAYCDCGVILYLNTTCICCK